ncbi:hypothetical protein VYV12_004728 [Salmonella enterica]|nr:hypothetical protein [Salmonella enterica]EME5254022.1 hypothetical protein [Salmonella enterica]
MKKENIDGSILWEQSMGAGLCSYALLPYAAPINKKASRKNNSRRLLYDVILFMKENCNLD